MGKIENIIASFAGILKLAGFLLLTVVLLPVTYFFKRTDPDHPFRIAQVFHRTVLRMLGISVRVHGQPSEFAPTLFVANHASYLDIIVLGALLPTSFVAKAEVAGWPLFGTLARAQNTVFVERRSTRAAAQHVQLQEYFAKKQNLVLFPEGTSSNGLTTLPFKSTLFSIVEESTHDIVLTVQPVSITCIELDGLPLLHEERALYAWYGDMVLAPHLWNVFKRGTFTVDVIFHPTLTMQDCPDRKILAATCQQRVAEGIERSLTRHG